MWEIQKRNERLTLYQYKLMSFKGRQDNLYTQSLNTQNATEKIKILGDMFKIIEERVKVIEKMKKEFNLDSI